MKNGVSLENRCQFIGHEIENVNVAIYTNKINVDELAAAIFPTLEKFRDLIDEKKPLGRAWLATSQNSLTRCSLLGHAAKTP